MMEADWGDSVRQSFDLHGLQRAAETNEIFDFRDLVTIPSEIMGLIDHCEKGSVARGRGEHFIRCFPGCKYSKSGGDVIVPGLGKVEIKHGMAKMASQKTGTMNALNHMPEAFKDICGESINSFAYGNLRRFFSNAKDTDAYGTAIAKSVNTMFPYCDRIADILLKKGFVRRLRASAETDHFNIDVTQEILIPLLEFNFDYYRAVDEFDIMLLMNDTRGVFVRRGSELVDLIHKCHVRIKPSNLNFTSSRSAAIGIALV